MHNDSIVSKKLVVQPLFISLVHLNSFMGPCRYGVGEQLTYEYEKKASEKTLAQFNKDISDYIKTDRVELLDTKYLEWHEDFAITEEALNAALVNDPKVDVYLISGTRLISYISTIIAKRTNKPLAFCPLSTSHYSRLGGIDAAAHLFALGYKEVYNALNYADLNRIFRVLCARKALRKTKVLYGIRNNIISFGCVSSFIDLNDITSRFGTEILNFNAMEFFKVLDELTDEDIEQAKQLTNELVKNANGMHMPAENILNDVKFYVAVKKVMKFFDCNAFTIPCFEMCATQELNKRKLTFCLTQSLLKDEGIPAACAADVGCIIAHGILMNLARKAPHMGNCMVIVDKMENNEMRILHDVSCRYMKGYDKDPLPIDYVSFTLGNWGATMRYDFAKDKGQDMTMINLSPRMDKIMVAKGTITGCDDFLTQECRHAVRFTVNDSRDFHEKEATFGHHFAWVYGDYVDDLVAFAKVMGMEAVIA